MLGISIYQSSFVSLVSFLLFCSLFFLFSVLEFWIKLLVAFSIFSVILFTEKLALSSAFWFKILKFDWNWFIKKNIVIEIIKLIIFI